MPELADFPQVSQITVVPFDSADFGTGRSYAVDTSFEPYRRQSTRHTTIPSQRESINLEGKTGEGTVNTEGLWRVNAPDWSYGAGQLYADRASSVANRFLASTGINALGNQYQATLLQAGIRVNAQQNDAGPIVLSLGPYVFWSYTTVVYYISGSWSNSPTSLTFSGSNFAGGEFITGMMIDNHALYISTNEALYQSNVLDGSAPTTAVKILSEGCICVGALGGRYFVAGYAQQNALFDVASTANPTTVPALPRSFSDGQLVVHPNPKWLWGSSALVDGVFYFSGTPLDHDSALVPNSTGEVWRTSYQGTSVQSGQSNAPLPAPQIALQLPPGEVVASMFGYANYCLLGTTQGVRVCRSVSANDPEGNTGDLIAGPILPNQTQPLTGWNTAFTANGRFVWFWWNGYNDTFVGGTTTPSNATVLGRLDMETMLDDLTPAYCSDLSFPAAAGYVFSMAWDPISNGPVVGILCPGSDVPGGIYVQDVNNVVGSGFIDSGLVTNNIPDDKIAAMVSERHLGTGSVSFKLQSNGGGYSAATPISPNTPSATPTLLSTLVRYEEANVSTILTRSSGNSGPTLKRWTLKSIPAVVSGTTVSYVTLLYSQVGSHGVKRQVDPYAELAWFESLRLSQQPVTIQEGNPNETLYTATAVVDSIDWLPEHERDVAPFFGWEGVAVVYFKTIVG